jgi:ribosomal protein L37AE/L43A
MINDITRRPVEKTKFNFCPQCGRKGLYHIKPQYLRCRYCGTYMVSPVEEKVPAAPETSRSEIPAIG